MQEMQREEETPELALPPTFLSAQETLAREASRAALEGLQLQGHGMASGNCCWEGLWGRKQGHQDVSLSAIRSPPRARALRPHPLPWDSYRFLGKALHLLGRQHLRAGIPPVTPASGLKGVLTTHSRKQKMLAT